MPPPLFSSPLLSALALTVTSEFVVEAACVPLIYLAAVATGRWLKRRQKVLIGFSYHLLAIVLALWLPLQFSRFTIPYREPMLVWLHALAALFGTIFVLALVRRFFWEGWFERTQQMQAPKFLRQIFTLLWFVIAVLLILQFILKKDISAALTASGVVAVVLGFAMQETLANIISGIALEIGKPFKTGDWLIVEGQHVEVIEVNWRSTRLRNNDDAYLDIPNKTIVGATITNLTYPTRQHAIRLSVGFDYNVPPNFVKDVMARATGEVRGVLPSPPPKVFLKDFGDSAIFYEIKFWLEDEANFNDIVDGIRTNVWYAAQRHGIRIPFPIRTIQLEKPTAKRQNSLDAARTSIRKQPFLQLLDETQVNQLLMHAKLERFGRGESVIRQGEAGESMFILLHGEAEVFVQTAGENTLVAKLHAGDYCGEMSLLTGEPRSATVIARTDCEMWEVEKNVVGEFLQSNQALVQKLGELLAERRMATEGILASTVDHQHMATKQKEYTAGFLRKLSSFFDL